MENGYKDNGFEESSGSRLVSLIAIGAIILSIIIIGSFYSSCISTYNELINMEENVKLAQAGVETMMQRRLELIPDLVETTKAASAHEKDIHTAIAEARAALTVSIENGDVQEMNDANEQLTVAVNELKKLIVEDYPELTASEHYMSLMDQLEGSVNRITIARENYNAAVSVYNKKVRYFPGTLIAKIFGFEEIEPFKANEESNNTNMVDFN